MQNSGDRGSLIEFSYVSRAVPEMPLAAKLRIVQQAWGFNTRMGITGEMLVGDGRFTQTIEGPSEVILGLASRILTDRRHQDISVLGFGPIDARRFRNWTVTGLVHDHAPALDPASARNVWQLAAVAVPFQALARPAVRGVSGAY